VSENAQQRGLLIFGIDHGLTLLPSATTSGSASNCTTSRVTAGRSHQVCPLRPKMAWKEVIADMQ
jgi:hypothetical protein